MRFDPASFAKAGAPGLDIVGVAGNIGAEIRDVRLSGDLDDDMIRAIRLALLRHKVIFFRGQHHLDGAGHEAFAERMGEPVRQPTSGAAEGASFLLDLKERESYAASVWHTDMTFMAEYPEASILRARVVPAAGGDTIWANTAAAYANLPAPLRILADNLTAIHQNTTDFEAQYEESVKARMGEMRYRKPSRFFETEHPVVQVHPETGERNLLLGQFFVRKFVGLSTEDSREVLKIFQAHVTREENTVRWRWQPGDVAIWDNRATQHRAVPDFGDQPRYLQRVTIQGRKAMGIDGAQSRQIRADVLA